MLSSYVKQINGKTKTLFAKIKTTWMRFEPRIFGFSQRPMDLVFTRVVVVLLLDARSDHYPNCDLPLIIESSSLCHKKYFRVG